LVLRRVFPAAGGGAVTGCLTDSPGTDDTTTGETTTTGDGPFRTVTVGDPDAVAFPDTHRPHVVDERRREVARATR